SRTGVAFRFWRTKDRSDSGARRAVVDGLPCRAVDLLGCQQHHGLGIDPARRADGERHGGPRPVVREVAQDVYILVPEAEVHRVKMAAEAVDRLACSVDPTAASVGE